MLAGSYKHTQTYTLVVPLCTAPTLPWRSLAMSFLQIWAKTPAGLLAAWDPVCVVMKRRKRRRKGKSFCRCEASRWRWVSYRHDNLESSGLLLLLLLLLRFRRLTLHSGYDGWNDSAKTSRLLLLRGKLRPPPAKRRKHTNKQEKLLLLLLWYT